MEQELAGMCSTDGCIVWQYNARAPRGGPEIVESLFVLLLEVVIGGAAVGFGYDCFYIGWVCRKWNKTGNFVN
jgi:hypothetical protein